MAHPLEVEGKAEAKRTVQNTLDGVEDEARRLNKLSVMLRNSELKLKMANNDPARDERWRKAYTEYLRDRLESEAEEADMSVEEARG